MYFRFQNIFIVAWVFLAATAACRQGHVRDEKSFSVLQVKERAMVSNSTSLTPQFFTNQGSKRTKVTYGPYEVPNMNINNGMIQYHEKGAELGCKDCLITWMEAGLEYPNGTYANANTSLWLHHTVLYNLDKLDSVCGSNVPGERFFASGNERSPINICVNGTNTAGYYVGVNDTVALLTELMNAGTENQTAVVTITYEYIPSLPATFNTVRPIWLDIGGCDTSDMPAENNTSFQYTSPVWSANIKGRITCAAGHLHDGGTHLDIMENNSTICDCQTEYGQTPGYVDPAGSMMEMGMMDSSMANMGMHISSLSECANGQVNLGDKLSVSAYYNTSEYAPMINADGSLAPIMGIAILYVAQNETMTSTPTASAGSSTSTSAAAVAAVTARPAMLSGIVGGMMVLWFA